MMSMKFFFVVCCSVMVLLMADTVPAKGKKNAGKSQKGKGKGKGKVTICHKGKNTITISKSALSAHLQHGDTQGECAAVAPAAQSVETVEQAATLYQYRYYPAAQVYFDAQRSLYFFLQEGIWQSSGTLPEMFALGEEQAVELEMDVQEPYTQHGKIMQKYQVVTSQQSYQYRYYPGAQIYFDTTRHQYFFQQEGRWQMSGILPESLNLGEEPAFQFELQEASPVVMHQTFVKIYSSGSGQEIHHYMYYPSSEVYYDAEQSIYFFRQDGEWRTGHSLPSAIIVNEAEAMTLDLMTDRPYLQHEMVLHLIAEESLTDILIVNEEGIEEERRDIGASKVTICHKGKKTLSIAEAAVPAHLKHGDTMGECAGSGRTK